MEGKAVLFKRFADIDSIDLEVSSEDRDDMDVLAGPPTRSRSSTSPRRRCATGSRRTRLPGRAHRRRALELLPARQPHRAPRARAALARRRGRQRAQGLPRRARHRPQVGGARARRRRPHRRPRGRDAAAARRPHRRPLVGRRAPRRARHAARTACGRGIPGALDGQRTLVESARRHLPPGRRRGRAARARRLRELGRTPRSSSSASAGASRLAAALTGPGIGATVDPRVGRHRRAHRHPRRRGRQHLAARGSAER